MKEIFVLMRGALPFAAYLTKEEAEKDMYMVDIGRTSYSTMHSSAAMVVKIPLHDDE